MQTWNMTYPGSKWLKHNILQENCKIQPHLPSTAKLIKGDLISFMDNHAVIYAKPSLGGGGKGIIRIQKTEDKFVISERTNQKIFRKMINAANYVLHRTANRPYIIQQGISLVTIDQRPVDFRSLLYKKKGTWHFAGIMAKQAAANRFTTNRCSGGTALTLEEAISKIDLDINHLEAGQVQEDMMCISMEIAQCLQQHFPKLRELGLDLALDENGYIWLIEANSRPQYKLFRSHENKKLYNEIDRDIKRLRRTKRPNKKYK